MKFHDWYLFLLSVGGQRLTCFTCQLESTQSHSKMLVFLFGLSIDGESMVDVGSHDWTQLCQDYLGVAPIGTHLKESMVKLKWLKIIF